MDFLPSLSTVFSGTICGVSSMLAINSYHCFFEHASTLHEIEQFCAQDQLEQVRQIDVHVLRTRLCCQRNFLSQLIDTLNLCLLISDNS